MMKMCLIFTLYLISAQTGCSEMVKGYRGGSVIINCKYNSQQYSNHTKYFCRITEEDCRNAQKWDIKGKFFAADDISAGVYSVLIRNLSQEDGGKYRFKVGNQMVSNTLHVENGLYDEQSFSHTSHPGDMVTFSCTYPETHKNDLKSVYRVTNQSISAIIFTYAESEEKGRYVLNVSSTDSVINMSISNVTVEDRGLYLCGVSMSMSTYVTIFSEMQLQVSATSSNTPSPRSSVIGIIVYVGLAVLLIVGFVLIFYKLWSTKSKGASSSSDDRGNICEERETERGKTGAYSPYYDEIPDTQTKTVYAVAKKPETRRISPNPDVHYDDGRRSVSL
ncbi:hypothetical protein AMELA_G00234980 [Ameiurus melas]|uniref:Immunoglobulin domain-containing protein n=1 Tax=Ameiurus melas TaxID=219545 RepID=A0A7J5ZXY0_AMEME|nr:hypothetical protein AMELA_G00234980 [Ameiurus melas]